MSDISEADIGTLASVAVLLLELRDRERLAFGAPLPETDVVIEAFADYLERLDA
jgi:hypothetical protein